jgi:hypothetical protein
MPIAREKATASFLAGADGMSSVHNQPRMDAIWNAQRRGAAVSDFPAFSGICAGAPVPEMTVYLATQEDVRQFRIGYTIAGAVCGLLIVLELAVLAATQPHAQKICPPGQAQIGQICARANTSSFRLRPESASARRSSP